MTKQDLQKELKEKVKEGVKPSDLRSKLSSLQGKGDDIRKLKKSKSTGDIPKAPLLPTSSPLTKSNSNPPTEIKYPYTTLISQQQEIEKLTKETQAKSDTISLLRKKIESLETQKEPTNTELDQHLIARHKNLKDWFTQYSKNKALDRELKENLDEASEELISQDQTISQLRSKNSKLKLTNQSLQKDLELAQKLAKLRKDNFPSPENTPVNSFWKGALIGCFLGLSLYLLNSFWKPNFKDN